MLLTKPPFGRKEANQMAHVEKFTKGQVQGLVIHLERLTENHSNPEIAIERTKDNYELCQKEGSMLERLNERLEEVHLINRKDVNVMANWIVTLPKELKEKSPEEIRTFFESTYDFLAKRYGIDNVVGAFVHMDETTPHMHFAFVPVVHDKKKNIDKVSAKEVLTRKELKVFHQDLDQHLLKEIPEIYQGGILNGETIGVENVEQLKNLTQRVKKLEQDITDKEKTIQSYKKQINEYEKSVKPIKNITTKLEQLKAVQSRSITGKVQLSQKDYSSLENMALFAVKEHNKNTSLERTYEGVIKEKDHQLNTLQTDKELLFQRNKSLDYEVSDLTKKNDNLRENRVIYRNLLKEKGYELTELTKMAPLERKSRYIIQSLQEFGLPGDNQKKTDWLETLKQAKSENLVIKGLNNALQLLLQALQRLFEHERER